MFKLEHLFLISKHFIFIQGVCDFKDKDRLQNIQYLIVALGEKVQNIQIAFNKICFYQKQEGKDKTNPSCRC